MPSTERELAAAAVTPVDAPRQAEREARREVPPLRDALGDLTHLPEPR